ncbi:MAG: hypothetical protein Q7R76_05845 [Candidatus Woesearchaeota archaeon]|nr:hypothetical protein [Candidatus Woesearchaeota archaeon]
MAKKILIWFILSILAILLLPSGLARTTADLRISNMQCHGDGSVTFTVENPSVEKLLLSSVEVRSIWLPGNQSITLRGNFSQPVISSQSTQTKKADFTSARGIFNESGRYKLSVTHDACTNPPCTKELFLNNCPGFQYDCALAAKTFTITDCRAMSDQYVLTFQGLNQDQYEKRDPVSQIAVYITSNARTIATPFIKGKQIKDTSKNTYVMTLPRLAHETATSIGLGIIGCPPENVRTCAITDFNSTDTLLKKGVVVSEEKNQSEETFIPTPELPEPTTDDSFLFLLLGVAVLLSAGIVILILVVVKDR